MLEQINLESILFLDIETVPQYRDYVSTPTPIREMWDHKSKFLLKKDEDTPESVYRSAGIYAEFGRIICISVGLLHQDKFRLKSFHGHDEKVLLNQFCELLEKSFSKKDSLLCAHNGKEFDFPYLSRRLLINGFRLPHILNTAGKKPWEVQHLDTMELWKFGDYKSFTSLNLLATIFGIPTPKDDIDGSKVYDVYYTENDLPRIVTYCQKDVLTVAQILLKMKGEPLIPQENIIVT